jgi:hypothetical protein
MPKKPRNPNPNTIGLIPKLAEDCITKPRPVTAHIEPCDISALDQLDGSRSFHIRQAIREYLISTQK